MKLTINDPILNVDGTEVKQEGDKSLLFVDVIVTSMTATLKADAEEKGDVMLKKWDLAERAHKSRGETMEVTTDEATFIKERIRQTFASTVIYANVHRLIEAAGK